MQFMAGSKHWTDHGGHVYPAAGVTHDQIAQTIRAIDPNAYIELIADNATPAEGAAADAGGYVHSTWEGMSVAVFVMPQGYDRAAVRLLLDGLRKSWPPDERGLPAEWVEPTQAPQTGPKLSMAGDEPAGAANGPQRYFVAGPDGVELMPEPAPLPPRAVTLIFDDPQTGAFKYRVGGFRVEGIDPEQSGGRLPVRWFLDALSYLEHDPHMRRIIQREEDRGTRIWLQFDLNKRPQFDSELDFIRWNPVQGAALPEFNGALQSPAMLLWHELVHADGFHQAPAIYDAAIRTREWRYRNAEERYAAGFENLAAGFLGEQLRMSHGVGEFVRVRGPLDRLLTVQAWDPLTGTYIDASVAPEYRFAVSQILDPTDLSVGPQDINSSVSLDAAGNVLGQFHAGTAATGQDRPPNWNLIKGPAGASLLPRPGSDIERSYIARVPAFDFRAIPAIPDEVIGKLGPMAIDDIGLFSGAPPEIAMSDVYRVIQPGGALEITAKAAPGEMKAFAEQIAGAGFADIGISFTRKAGEIVWTVKATKPLQGGSAAEEAPLPTVLAQDPESDGLVDARVDWAKVPDFARLLDASGILHKKFIRTASQPDGLFDWYRRPDSTFSLWPIVKGSRVVSGGSLPGSSFDKPFDYRAIPDGALDKFPVGPTQWPFDIGPFLGTPPDSAISDVYRILQAPGKLTILTNAAPGDMIAFAQQLAETGFADIGISFTQRNGIVWTVKATKPLEAGSVASAAMPLPTVKALDQTGRIVNARVNWADVPAVADGLNLQGVFDLDFAPSFHVYRQADGTHSVVAGSPSEPVVHDYAPGFDKAGRPALDPAQTHVLQVSPGDLASFSESLPGEPFSGKFAQVRFTLHWDAISDEPEMALAKIVLSLRALDAAHAYLQPGAGSVHWYWGAFDQINEGGFTEPEQQGYVTSLFAVTGYTDISAGRADIGFYISGYEPDWPSYQIGGPRTNTTRIFGLDLESAAEKTTRDMLPYGEIVPGWPEHTTALMVSTDDSSAFLNHIPAPSEAKYDWVIITQRGFTDPMTDFMTSRALDYLKPGGRVRVICRDTSATNVSINSGPLYSGGTTRYLRNSGSGQITGMQAEIGVNLQTNGSWSRNQDFGHHYSLSLLPDGDFMRTLTFDMRPHSPRTVWPVYPRVLRLSLSDPLVVSSFLERDPARPEYDGIRITADDNLDLQRPIMTSASDMGFNTLTAVFLQAKAYLWDHGMLRYETKVSLTADQDAEIQRAFQLAGFEVPDRYSDPNNPLRLIFEAGINPGQWPDSLDGLGQA
jgi:hypothetical protein